jgi:hypothetical protein
VASSLLLSSRSGRRQLAKKLHFIKVGSNLLRLNTLDN